ncbi:MAG: XRE family transcriptional regulator [Bryobacteraceae bacterium]
MRGIRGNENVFVDCGFPPAEVETLRIRAKLMMALTGYLQERKITQARAAKVMGVSQPRISHLVRGKIGLFAIDTPVNMVAAAGLVCSRQSRPTPIPHPAPDTDPRTPAIPAASTGPGPVVPGTGRARR